MTRKKNILFWIVIIFVGILSILLFLQVFLSQSDHRTIKAEKNPTTISFDSTTIDMGSIVLYQPKEVAFRFINTGKNPLVIHSVKASCGCTTPKLPEKIIMPGETGTILITYNAANLGLFRKSINIYANVNHSPVSLEIYGEVKKK
jgi:hypothetical protein